MKFLSVCPVCFSICFYRYIFIDIILSFNNLVKCSRHETYERLFIWANAHMFNRYIHINKVISIHLYRYIFIYILLSILIYRYNTIDILLSILNQYNIINIFISISHYQFHRFTSYNSVITCYNPVTPCYSFVTLIQIIKNDKL